MQNYKKDIKIIKTRRKGGFFFKNILKFTREPLQGSRPCRLKRKKHAHKRVFLVLVDDQGLEPWAH